jgi:hypothetical protein
MTHWNTLVTGTVWLCIPFASAIFLFLIKAKTHVCTPKDAEDGPSAYFASSHGVSWAV